MYNYYEIGIYGRMLTQVIKAKSLKEALRKAYDPRVCPDKSAYYII